MQVSGACLCGIGWSGRRYGRVRAASESVVQVEMDKVKLGGSDLKVTRIGIGAWSWGDTSYWNNLQWNDRMLKDAKFAFEASLDCGISFFDTAEVYGSGVCCSLSDYVYLLIYF